MFGQKLPGQTGRERVLRPGRQAPADAGQGKFYAFASRVGRQPGFRSHDREHLGGTSRSQMLGLPQIVEHFLHEGFEGFTGEPGEVAGQEVIPVHIENNAPAPAQFGRQGLETRLDSGVAVGGVINDPVQRHPGLDLGIRQRLQLRRAKQIRQPVAQTHAIPPWGQGKVGEPVHTAPWKRNWPRATQGENRLAESES